MIFAYLLVLVAALSSPQVVQADEDFDTDCDASLQYSQTRVRRCWRDGDKIRFTPSIACGSLVHVILTTKNGDVDLHTNVKTGDSYVEIDNTYEDILENLAEDEPKSWQLKWHFNLKLDIDGDQQSSKWCMNEE